MPIGTRRRCLMKKPEMKNLVTLFLLTSDPKRSKVKCCQMRKSNFKLCRHNFATFFILRCGNWFLKGGYAVAKQYFFKKLRISNFQRASFKIRNCNSKRKSCMCLWQQHVFLKTKLWPAAAKKTERTASVVDLKFFFFGSDPDSDPALALISNPDSERTSLWKIYYT